MWTIAKTEKDKGSVTSQYEFLVSRQEKWTRQSLTIRRAKEWILPLLPASPGLPICPS